MKTKKTDPSLSDYGILIEKLCKANKVSELEDLYNGFFKTKNPVFPKDLIKTDKDSELVRSWIGKTYTRIRTLKASSKDGLETGSFFTIITGDIFLGTGLNK